jgi:hypothetical protein
MCTHAITIDVSESKTVNLHVCVTNTSVIPPNPDSAYVINVGVIIEAVSVRLD